MGVLSRTSPQSGRFIKDMPDVNQVQIGTTKRTGKNFWGSNLKVRNLTVYDRALLQKKLKNVASFLKEESWKRNFLKEQKLRISWMFLKVVRTASRIKMVSQATVFQPC